jgi:hypothetical protein
MYCSNLSTTRYSRELRTRFLEAIFDRLSDAVVLYDNIGKVTKPSFSAALTSRGLDIRPVADQSLNLFKIRRTTSALWRRMRSSSFTSAPAAASACMASRVHTPRHTSAASSRACL